jgi:hypothetical protein
MKQEDDAGSISEKQRDKEIILEAVKQNPKEFANEKQSVMAAINQNQSLLRTASESLQKDKEFVLELVRKNPKIIEFSILNSDQEVVLEAIHSNMKMNVEKSFNSHIHR